MNTNPGLYQASLEVLLNNGVPQDIAEKASTIVAKDDPQKNDLGRTKEDKEVIQKAFSYLQQCGEVQS